MKAVIVDITSKYAIALDKKGEFLKIKNNGKYSVGYEIDIPQSINLSTFIKPASIAAVFLFVVGISFGTYSYYKPYSYINVDINPSIEITTNIYDRIIKTEGLNEDGRKLLVDNTYKNKNLEDGIEGILESAVENGYLKVNSQNDVIFTVSSKSDKKADKIKSKIQGTASEELKSTNVSADVLLEKASLEKHNEASKLGISPGKLGLINKLIDTEPQLEVEDLKDKPVKEIMSSIKEDKKDNKADNKQDKDKSNNGNKVKPTDNSKKPVASAPVNTLQNNSFIIWPKPGSPVTSQQRPKNEVSKPDNGNSKKEDTTPEYNNNSSKSVGNDSSNGKKGNGNSGKDKGNSNSPGNDKGNSKK